MVFYLLLHNQQQLLPENWQRFLPSHRIEKALAYRQEKDRVASVAAFLLLRYALYKEYADTTMPQIETDENGKPFAVNAAYHFNLSHCETAVACALDAAPVGVDVQDFRPVRSNVISKVCSLEEQLLLQNSDHPEQLFAAFWASKEAYGKCLGHGIGYDLQSTCFCKNDTFPALFKTEDDVICTELKDTFALSVCAGRKLQTEQISPAEWTRVLQLF